ncbi:MAG: 3-phosphoshikimate 1-carboxyvinyltransferase, partial [Deltaproteobacteria bacterium]|nr:3-phosphoshikimate 1-carboxyvinyltransferase [Deltaproteobacteria bacterium]
DISGEELLPAIDEFPIICVAAALAEGKTTISGAAELRVKESDRIKVMAHNLTSIGVKVFEREDGIIIEGSPEGLKGGEVATHGDHRIAMSFAVAGLFSDEGVTIKGAECVDVSFPGFFTLLDSVRDS